MSHDTWDIGTRLADITVKVRESQAKQPANETQMWCPGNISKSTYTPTGEQMSQGWPSPHHLQLGKEFIPSGPRGVLEKVLVGTSQVT